MRLRHPVAETVVHCEGDLAARLVSAGWVDDSPKHEAATEKPQRRTRARRASKTGG